MVADAGHGSRSHYLTYVPEGFRWHKTPHIRHLMAWICLYLFGNFANGYDNALFNGLQILPEWQNFFNHPTGSRLGLLGAMQNIGLEIGVVVAPFWNDYFGRRKTVFLGGCLMLIGAAFEVAAQNEGYFLAGRCILGFGDAFINNADAIMSMELAYPPHRAPIAGSYNSITNIGSIVAAVVTFGTYYMKSSSWTWRLPLLIQVVPAFFQLTFCLWGPESPRWLMSKGRNQEAFDILVKYHGGGDEKDPMVLYEYEEMQRIVEEEKSNKHFGYVYMFSTPGMRRRTFTMMGLAFSGQMSGNGLVSYYLNQVLTTVGITNKPAQLGINVGLSVWNFVCGFTAGIRADKFGRRPIFLTSVVGILFCFTGVTICSAEYVMHHTKSAGSLTVFFIFAFTGFYAWAWSSVQALYSLEIFPSSVRAKSNGVHGITQAGFQLLNQYVNPIAFSAIGWKYYIVFDVLIVFIGFFIYFFLIETKGYTLEETAALYDGVDFIADLQRTAEVQMAADKGRTEAEIVHHGALDIEEGNEKDIVEHHDRVASAHVV